MVFRNVSRCSGCKGKIKRGQGTKPLPSPDDLVLRHKEYVIFNNPKTGRFEQSWEKNVYYHPWKMCIMPNFIDFDPKKHLAVGDNVHLHPSHINLIEFEFGLRLE